MIPFTNLLGPCEIKWNKLLYMLGERTEMEEIIRHTLWKIP